MSDKQEYCKIKLLQNDRIYLDLFLTMTTNYRQRELNAWQELAKEKNQDGTPVYKNAIGNAKWWNELCNAVPRIKEGIKNYEYINEKDEIDICE